MTFYTVDHHPELSCRAWGKSIISKPEVAKSGKQRAVSYTSAHCSHKTLALYIQTKGVLTAQTAHPPILLMSPTA